MYVETHQFTAMQFLFFKYSCVIKAIQPQLQRFTFICALILYFIQYKIKIQILQNSAAECHFILLLIGHAFKVAVASNCKPCSLCLSVCMEQYGFRWRDFSKIW